MKMFNEVKGQISAELILLMGFLIIISVLSIVFVSYENELNIAILVAREGVNDGLFVNGLAIYPDVTYMIILIINKYFYIQMIFILLK